MPHREGVDDNPELLRLIALWREGADDLDGRIAAVWRAIRAELQAGREGGFRVDRLRKQVARLGQLRADAEFLVDSLAADSRAVIDAEIPRVYEAGAARVAGVAFTFTAPHRAAVEVMAADLFDDVLDATRFVDQSGKQFVRRVGRRIAGAKLTGGEAAKASGRRLERDLAKEFRGRGIGGVTYRDGSVHSFGEYAEMLIRTKTGVAYNAGTLNHSRLAGIDVFELLDGDECGLTEHTDPVRANGLFVDFDTAQSWPLSHPNCRRAINPRPDLSRDSIDGAVSDVAPEARADQAAFEEALRRQAADRRRRRARRAARSARTGRQSSRGPRTGREARNA